MIAIPQLIPNDIRMFSNQPGREFDNTNNINVNYIKALQDQAIWDAQEKEKLSEGKQQSDQNGSKIASRKTLADNTQTKKDNDKIIPDKDSKPISEVEATKILNQLKAFGTAVSKPSLQNQQLNRLGDNYKFLESKKFNNGSTNNNNILNNFNLLRKELDSNKNIDEILKLLERKENIQTNSQNYNHDHIGFSFIEQEFKTINDNKTRYNISLSTDYLQNTKNLNRRNRSFQYGARNNMSNIINKKNNTLTNIEAKIHNFMHLVPGRADFKFKEKIQNDANKVRFKSLDINIQDITFEKQKIPKGRGYNFNIDNEEVFRTKDFPTQEDIIKQILSSSETNKFIKESRNSTDIQITYPKEITNIYTVEHPGVKIVEINSNSNYHD